MTEYDPIVIDATNHFNDISRSYFKIKNMINEIIKLHKDYINEVKKKEETLEEIKKIFFRINEHATGSNVIKEVNRLKKYFTTNFNIASSKEIELIKEMDELNKKNYGDKAMVLANQIKNTFLKEGISINIHPIDFKNIIDEMEYNIFSLRKFNKADMKEKIKKQIEYMLNELKMSINAKLLDDLIDLKKLVDNNNYYSGPFEEEFHKRITSKNPHQINERKGMDDFAKLLHVIRSELLDLKDFIKNPKRAFQPQFATNK